MFCVGVWSCVDCGKRAITSAFCWLKLLEVTFFSCDSADSGKVQLQFMWRLDLDLLWQCIILLYLDFGLSRRTRQQTLHFGVRQSHLCSGLWDLLMSLNVRDAVSRVSGFVCYISWRIEKHLCWLSFLCLYLCSSCGFCSLASVDYFIDACVDYGRLCCFQRFILAPVPPFPLKCNNSTLRVYVGLSLCVNVIFCETDLIV